MRGSPGPDIPICGAPGRQIDRPCRKIAGFGTNHPGIGRCKYHGGTTPSGMVAAQKALFERGKEQLRAMAAKLGASREVDPAEASLELVWEAAGNVEFYRQLLERLDHLSDENGEDFVTNLYAPLYHATGVKTGEAKKSIVIAMYDEERDRLARYVKDALSSKIDERRVQLAETQARSLFAAVSVAMEAANMTADQAEKFRRALTTSLRGGPIGSVALPGGDARGSRQEA